MLNEKQMKKMMKLDILDEMSVHLICFDVQTFELLTILETVS